MMREVPVRDTDPDPYNMSHNLEVIIYWRVGHEKGNSFKKDF